MLAFLAKLDAAWTDQPDPDRASANGVDRLTNACHAMMNSAAFLYID